MTADVQQEVQKWLRLFERGVYTWHEIVGLIELLASSPGFFECLDSFPEQLVADLREHALHAASHPEDIVCRPNEMRVQFFWCGLALRKHFFPELPLPAFEPCIRIGTVREAACVKGRTVLVGDFLFWMIRENPVHCITPDGDTIAVTVASDHPVKYFGDKSSNESEKALGPDTLTLGEGAGSPERFPPGTTVWVDRTNVADIPPPKLPA